MFYILTAVLLKIQFSFMLRHVDWQIFIYPYLDDTFLRKETVYHSTGRNISEDLHPKMGTCLCPVGN